MTIINIIIIINYYYYYYPNDNNNGIYMNFVRFSNTYNSISSLFLNPHPRIDFRERGKDKGGGERETERDVKRNK